MSYVNPEEGGGEGETSIRKSWDACVLPRNENHRFWPHYEFRKKMPLYVEPSKYLCGCTRRNIKAVILHFKWYNFKGWIRSSHVQIGLLQGLKSNLLTNIPIFSHNSTSLGCKYTFVYHIILLNLILQSHHRRFYKSTY